MQTVAIAGIFNQLRQGVAEPPSDAELLDAFVARRDEAAFGELVLRHGPKVYAVCRRVLGQHHLAEDAFQATFVVLARKARSVYPRSAVAGFLYGVARKAALEASVLSRRRKEMLVARVPDAPSEAQSRIDSDALAALDEEIANLSETLRSAVVLCELDGVSRAEAARQLGVPEGTLSSRLATARRQLAAKLTARGIACTVALFATLAASASAAVPPALKNASPTVSAIAQGVLRTMLFAKLKIVTAVCVTGAALALWALAPAGGASAAPAPKPLAPGAAESRLVGGFPIAPVKANYRAPVPSAPNQEPRDKTFVVGLSNRTKRNEVAELLNPAGVSQGYLPVGELWNLMNPRVSPDGKRLAFLRQRPASSKEDKGVKRGIPLELYVVDLSSKEPPTEPLVRDLRCRSITCGPSIAWSPDSKQLYISAVSEGKEVMAGQVVPVTTRLFDLATKKETALDIPEGHGRLRRDPRRQDGSHANNSVGPEEHEFHFVSRAARDVEAEGDYRGRAGLRPGPVLPRREPCGRYP